MMMQVFLGNALIFRCSMECTNLSSVAIPSSATRQAPIWPTSWQWRWWNWTMNTRRGRWNSAKMSHQLRNLWFGASQLWHWYHWYVISNFLSQLVWIDWILLGGWCVVAEDFPCDYVSTIGCKRRLDRASSGKMFELIIFFFVLMGGCFDSFVPSICQFGCFFQVTDQLKSKIDDALASSKS